MSKIVPNTTQTPNLYMDKLMYFLDDCEYKTLTYAVRRTMGFHKGSDRIALSQFMNGNGRTDSDGELVELGTGFAKGAQIRALQNLVKFGILIQVSEPTSRTATEWALQMDESEIDFDALRERKAERKQIGKRQTKKARVSAAAKEKQRGLFSVPLDEGSVQQTPGVQRTEPLGGCSTDPQKKEENQIDRKPDNKRVKEQDPNLELTWGMLNEFCENNKDLAKTLWQLQEAYSEKSNIPRPDIDTEYGRDELLKYWWPTLKAVLVACDGDLGKAVAAFEQGVTKQSEWKADSVSAPSSVQKKTMAVVAAWKRGADLNGNGKQTKGAAGNGRQPTRRMSSSTQAAINVAKMMKDQKQRMANNE